MGVPGPFERKAEHGFTRQAMVLAYFGTGPFAKMVEGARYCYERFLSQVPRDALTWAAVGLSADTFKPLNGATLTRCASMLKPAYAAKKDLEFRLLGPEAYGPDFCLTVSGEVDTSPEGFSDPSNLVELRFPLEWLVELGADALAETAIDLFDHLPCDSGYASPALCPGTETAYDKAAAFIAPIAARRPGYDVANNRATSGFIGKRCRGARWLTMLSKELVNELGGPATLNTELIEDVSLLKRPSGVVMRAGQSPEMGDVNRGDGTPLLTSVAHAIEPITHFGDRGLWNLFETPERALQWERRFWPPE